MNERQICNFRAPENFVVFECVYRLLSKGYRPEHIELEPKWKVGHGASGGRADILIKDNSGKAFLIIECKTFGAEFKSEWERMLHDGGQLFSYRQQELSTQYVCLYASDIIDGASVYNSHIIAVRDNPDYLKSISNPLAFSEASDVKALFAAWRDTYKREYETRGIFEPGITAYEIGKAKRTANDLSEISHTDIQRKYHAFATILRQHNVSGRENAFDKLVNLFLAKIVDEAQNADELMFNWRGNAFDDHYRLQDRIQRLYRDGMQKFLNEKVTYIDNEQINDAFRLFANDPDATRDTIMRYFRELKFYTNNDFAFLDVHNEQLFFQNSEILNKIVLMLQDIKLKTEEQNQFLGDLFEGFLDQGIKQSEGQFFTPTPIVKFLVSSLPLERLINENAEALDVIDYACGAGHFLNEYATQIRAYVEKEKLKDYYRRIVGVEKEYRLSKVAKVSAFMYGQDDINIVYADALARHSEIKGGVYNVLISNPPYSVKGFLETLPEDDRNEYDITKAIDQKGISTNNSIEAFFVERAKQLLAPGGAAAIILPSSILTNGGAVYVRARGIILKYFDIVAIAEFGSGTFGKTGTNTVTMFLRRKAVNPTLADHCQNRVNAWFNGDFGKYGVFDDSNLLTAYCGHVRLPIDDYKTLLTSAPNVSLLETDIFKSYKTAFYALTEIKQLGTKQFFLKMPADGRSAELQRRFIEYVRSIEREKLYYFMLAYANPQPVVVVKSPSGTAEMKKFLGYEWSSAKGAEGIKYLGAAAIDENGEPVIGSRGINSIQTPLFNPLDLTASDKINTIIRNNFNCESKGKSEFITRFRLVDMIDFSGVRLEKAISLTATQKNEITSKYPLVALGSVCYIVAGQSPESIFYNEDRRGMPFYQGKTEFTKKYIGVPKKWTTSVTKTAIPKDIVMSVRAPVGPVNIVVNNICIGRGLAAIRCRDSIDYLYLFNALKLIEDSISGHSNVGFASISSDEVANIKIPLPPLDIQREIVAACEAVDEEYYRTRMSIEENREQIEILFSGLEINNNMETEVLSKLITFNPPKTELASVPNDTIVSFVEMASVSDEGYIETMVDRPLSQVRKGSYTYFGENDIIIAKITPCMENGKCAIAVNLKNRIGLGSSEFHVLRCGEKINNLFLFGYLNRKVIRDEAERHMTGASGHRRVPISFYQYLSVPLPPIIKQLEFAEKTLEIKVRITEAKRKLAELETRKQNILAEYLN